MQDGHTSDWPLQPAELRNLDNALRCKICCEFFSTPKILPCGHTFCSECIRNTGLYQHKNGQSRTCPECRAAWEETHLDSTGTVQSLGDVATAFAEVRAFLLTAVRGAQHDGAQGADACVGSGDASAARKRTRDKPNRVAAPQPLPKRRRASDAAVAEPQRKDSEDSAADTDAITSGKSDDGDAGDADWTVEEVSRATSTCREQKRADRGPAHAPPPVKVPQGCGSCPMCNRVVSLELLPSHVELCIIKAEAAPRHTLPAARKGQPTGVAAADGDRLRAPQSGSSAVGAPPIDLTDDGRPGGSGLSGRLPVVPPKLLFRIMKEKDIRKKLQEVGLSAEGDKKEMEKRYSAFRVFVQTARDANKCATLSTLAKQFNQRDRQHQTAVDVGPSVVKDAVGSFDELIEQAKRRREEAAQARSAAAAAQPSVPFETDTVPDQARRPANGADADDAQPGLRAASIDVPAPKRHDAGEGDACASDEDSVPLDTRSSVESHHRKATVPPLGDGRGQASVSGRDAATVDGSLLHDGRNFCDLPRDAVGRTLQGQSAGPQELPAAAAKSSEPEPQYGEVEVQHVGNASRCLDERVDGAACGHVAIGDGTSQDSNTAWRVAV